MPAPPLPDRMHPDQLHPDQLHPDRMHPDRPARARGPLAALGLGLLLAVAGCTDGADAPAPVPASPAPASTSPSSTSPASTSSASTSPAPTSSASTSPAPTSPAPTPSSTGTPTSATPTATSSTGSATTSTATSSSGVGVDEIVEGFPLDVVPIYPDAQVTLSNVVPNDAGRTVALAGTTAGSPASLVDFYSQALTAEGFTATTPAAPSGATIVTFTRGEDAADLLTLSITGGAGLQNFTIGGQLA